MSLRTLNGRGSVWHRWDPHIHVPGTALNDQYGSASLEDFCHATDACDPAIRALGITDYYSIRGYEQIVQLKKEGRLAGVDLIFPNVEIRLTPRTKAGSGVNLHLMFSPETADHPEEIKRFLQSLKCRAYSEDFSCTEQDLIRLGRRANNSITDASAAYREGANQFKLDLQTLEDAFKTNAWARENCIVAVAGGTNDGTAGLQGGAYQAIRSSIQALCACIFSGNPSDRDFWLGRGAETPETIESHWGGLKPCIHGSDAHELGRVGKPNDDRFCWIKGDVTFDALRHACIEPHGRVFIGPEPPSTSRVSSTIDTVRVSGADWLQPSEIQLNRGLTAIIGARGSGKTALADLIAAGGYATGGGDDRKRSFIDRAAEFLGETSVVIEWLDGSTSGCPINEVDHHSTWEGPQVQYLSQQFVERLCAAEGLASELVSEVQRVIFDAHPQEQREDATSFDDLYEIRCRRIEELRMERERELSNIAEALLHERQLRSELEKNKNDLKVLRAEIDKLKKDAEQLVPKGKEQRLRDQQAVDAALTVRRSALQALQKRLRALKDLQSDLAEFRTKKAPAYVASLQDSRAEATLSAAEWKLFLPQIGAGADNLLVTKIAETERDIATIQGQPVATSKDPTVSFLDGSRPLAEHSVSIIQAESARLAGLIGIDQQSARQYASVTKKMGDLAREVPKLEGKITRAEKAAVRGKELVQERRTIYREVFQLIENLEEELHKLYGPLSTQLQQAEGTLGKLSFVVRRSVDTEKWCQQGEELLDLRFDGPFRGRGSLLKEAQKSLHAVWEKGSAEDVSQAIHDFIQEHSEAIRKHRPESMDAREWGVAISKWIHSTAHVTVVYGLQYDGVDIERLSPGTRGIVLLLLYLAIDQHDDRPLIVDQPEENLDPQSIFNELVQRFRDAKLRRQIVIVTHNANLVVNTDADQVIVATSGAHSPGKLPVMTYISGGLENPKIRDAVCKVLEGGEKAFRDRARRLRVGLQSTHRS